MKVARQSRTATPDYFQQQTKVDALQKERLAKWVLREYPLRDHAGVMVDAGSTVYQVWRRIKKGLESGRYHNLRVMTNNFPVLFDWIETQHSHLIPGTTVDVAGGIFDPIHRTFYGGQERKKVQNMFSSYAYIGMAGVEVDDAGRLLIGYHRGLHEVQSKHVLFQMPCEARILLTPRKIGYTGSTAINLFDIPNGNWKSPIYLISTKWTNADEKKAFDRFRSSLLEGRVRQQILRRQITFHWKVVNCSGSNPVLEEDLTVSPQVYEELGCHVDELDRSRGDRSELEELVGGFWGHRESDPPSTAGRD
jgi:DeoR/GlpR family transcriptional regulator of sugar metabolism